MPSAARPARVFVYERGSSMRDTTWDLTSDSTWLAAGRDIIWY